jgi:hypothetical protein
MQSVDLLIVGDAADGPLGEIVPVGSFEECFRLFGGYSYFETTVTSGQAAVTLPAPAWSNALSPLTPDSDGTLLPTRLFEMAVSGAAVTWTPLGESRDVVFRWVTRPTGRRLLQGLLAAQLTGANIALLRLGTGAAAAVSAASGGFVFRARYAGSRYNGTTIVVSGDRVTVTPAAGTGRNSRYQPASDTALSQSLLDDLARGRSGIYLTGPLNGQRRSVPSGSYTLTGGADGTFTGADLVDFLENEDMGGVDVLCPVGLLTPELSGAGLLESLSRQDYPTLVVAQAPLSGDATSGIVIAHRYLASIAFSVQYDPGTGRERREDAAPMVAGLIANSRFKATLLPLVADAPSPRYGPAALAALASGGHIAAYLSIRQGPALWHAVTGEPDWPVSTVRAFQEIARALFTVLEPVLGQTRVDIDSLNDRLGAAFAGVEGSQVTRWQLELSGDELLADLDFRPWGEIREVRAQLLLGTPVTDQQV